MTSVFFWILQVLLKHSYCIDNCKRPGSDIYDRTNSLEVLSGSLDIEVIYYLAIFNALLIYSKLSLKLCNLNVYAEKKKKIVRGFFWCLLKLDGFTYSSFSSFGIFQHLYCWNFFCRPLNKTNFEKKYFLIYFLCIFSLLSIKNQPSL